LAGYDCCVVTAVGAVVAAALCVPLVLLIATVDAPLEDDGALEALFADAVLREVRSSPERGSAFVATVLVLPWLFTDAVDASSATRARGVAPR